LSTLYITATPIGNLNDISLRALTILKTVDVIAAEDTRHSQRLLQYYGISTPLMAYHQHNERESIALFLNKLKSGQSIALISDAGTPCISDPGYHLVKAVLEADINVVPVPGACAAVSALSASGLPSDHFVFEGFLPASPAARKNRLKQLCTEIRTMIFYEAPHRIKDFLQDIVEIFGESREATLARELTKTFETIYKSSLKDLYHFVKNNQDQQKGECVVVVSGSAEKEREKQKFEKAVLLLDVLLADLPLKKAVKITADVYSVSKNILYEEALRRQK
jgi:16S rRNA (cytidine1402-2'-O)-methyltransferase